MNTHPDTFKLLAALEEHDRRQGAAVDADGKTTGVDQFSLMGAGAYRSRQLFENFSPLRQTLSPHQVHEVIRLMASMWMDGFQARHFYDEMHKD